ncbi:Receptor-type tyrosine-protein phosphatase delta [Acropora cervicornis]|uniref:protein-tyrosine-phosphatase n=1 Tax=Acropora cervicornis TaxID=6130 RepID=A0AAD9QY75_ACRCE|nr:Receptor-type tyrosine-protein phosphatase delta [Acropora cervicornis]
MDPLTQRREIFILLLWTVFCFGFGRKDAPTANLTIAPKAALERSYMHFFCKVTGFPAPNITWYKNDSAIRRLPWFTRLPVAGGEFLRLGSMRWYRHDGVYHCRASNEVGTATSKKTSLIVYKVKRSPQEFPKIIKQTFGQRIYTGDDARYECNATGNPAPKISWMVDKLPVNLSNPRYSLPSPGVLTVANIQQGDHGTLFECVATNIHGMVYSRGTRLMHKFRYSAPVISKPPQPVTVDPETVVYLYCSAYGLPHPAILWERDGQSYSSAETTYGKLVIPNIQKSGMYTCVAENHFGRTRASAYVTVRKLPFTPSRPTASEITPHTITITWRPGVGGPPVKSFTVYHRTKSSSDWTVVTGIAGRDSLTLENLKPYTTYQFRVFALNEVGTSKPSSLLEVTTHEKAPGTVPRNIQARGISDNSFEATWLPPLEPNGLIYGYRLFYTTDLTTDFSLWRYKPSAENETVVERLQRHTTYYFRIAAYNVIGQGPLTGLYAVKVARGAPSGPPQNIRSKALQDSTSLEINWDPPLPEHRNGRITNYTVRYKEKGGRARSVTVDGSKTSIRLHSLKKYTPYYVWVSASTSVSVGPTSKRHEFTTAEDVPSGAPRKLNCVVKNSSVIEVSWKPPSQTQEGRIQGYTVFYTKVDDQGNSLQPPSMPRVKHTPTENLVLLLTHLDADTTYLIQVAAFTKKGDGAKSIPRLAKTFPKPPDPPHIVGSIRPSSDVLIRWLTVDTGVLSYKLRYGKSLKRLRGRQMEELEMKEITPLSKNSHTFKGLDPGVWYLFKISVRNKVGWSKERFIWVKTAPAPPSGPPLDVRASTLSSISVQVTWKKPDQWKRNGPLIGYSVVYNPLYRMDLSMVKNVTNPNQTNLDVTDLMMYTDYEIRVRAHGSMGPGPLSLPVITRTAEGVPGACRDLKASSIASEAITLSWRPPISYSASKNYTENGAKQQLTHDQEVGLDATSTGLQSYTIDGLVPYTNYYLIIIVPLGNSNQLPEDQVPDDFFKEVRRRKRNPDNVKEEPYIAAKFRSEEMPKKFNVGDKKFKNRYGYNNKELTKGVYYTMFTRAYVRNNKGFPSPCFKDALSNNIAIFNSRKRRGGNKKSKSMAEENEAPSDPVVLKRMTIQTPGLMDHPPIPVNELSDRIRDMRAESNAKFTQEYESIEPGQTFTSDASLLEYNRPKNRYPNILAFDHSRVHLSMIDEIPGSDYINANFCDVKCEQYWPTEGTGLYGEIEVTVSDWVEFANYAITTLQVSKQGAPHREVKHFQFSGWPDHGVPPHPTPFLAFLRRVRAGVGRTACFIVIDSMLERLKHENTVDVYGHVTVLRTQRNFMVQTDGYRQRFAYIATQAPLNDTVDDFWRMLMEHNSNIIVMLTQLHEGDRERCCKYWPTDRSEKYQYYVVDPISEQEYSTFVMRDFKVKDAKSGTVRNIKQFHFFGWSDSKLSESGGDILDLIGQVQKAYEQQGEEGPITVHCSDGVGRTGVFCALCIVLERMRCEGVVDLFQTVKLLRTQRPNMIQNQVGISQSLFGLTVDS